MSSPHVHSISLALVGFFIGSHALHEGLKTYWFPKNVGNHKDKSKQPPRNQDLILKLNFDVNKTIVMFDSAENNSSSLDIDAAVKPCIRNIIAYNVWGTFDRSKPKEKRTLSDFKFISETAFQKPCLPNGVDFIVRLVDFLWYHCALDKSECKNILHHFTEKEGGQYRKDFDRAMKKLSDSGSSLNLVPSFFEVLKYVEALKVKSGGKIDYQIIFRTFGTDADVVASEYNSICDQTHNLYKLDHSIEERKIAFPDHLLAIIRHGDNDDELRVLRVKGRDQNSHLKFVQRMEKPGNFSDIMALLPYDLDKNIRDKQEKNLHSWCIQDDYSWWHKTCKDVDDNIYKHTEFPDSSLKTKGRGGKIMLVEPDELGLNAPTASYFFDDNIELDNANIVDCRQVIDVEDGRLLEPVDWKVSKNRFLINVNPLQAIEDDNYYVNLVKDRIRNTHPSLCQKYPGLF